MKKWLFLIGSIVIVGCNSQKEKIELKTDSQKSSYAIGQQIGKNFRIQGLNLSKNELILGISDALENKNLLKPEEIQEAIVKVQQAVLKKNQEKNEKQKLDNLTFLENQKKSGKYKSSQSGLLFLIEKEGKGKKPTKDSTVKINFRGTLVNGIEFDSSYRKNQPTELKLNQIMQGLSEAILLMQVGAKIRVIIPSELGYSTTSRPGIPPNSVLLYEIELLDIK